MLVIWKYGLLLEPKQTIKVPAGFKFLSVHKHSEEPERIQLFALVDPAAEKIDLEVRIYSTGHGLHEKELISNYIGSVKLNPFTWHVFAGATL